jgi:hypothetical protein
VLAQVSRNLEANPTYYLKKNVDASKCLDVGSLVCSSPQSDEVFTVGLVLNEEVGSARIRKYRVETYGGAIVSVSTKDIYCLFSNTPVQLQATITSVTIESPVAIVTVAPAAAASSEPPAVSPHLSSNQAELAEAFSFLEANPTYYLKENVDASKCLDVGTLVCSSPQSGEVFTVGLVLNEEVGSSKRIRKYRVETYGGAIVSVSTKDIYKLL